MPIEDTIEDTTFSKVYKDGTEKVKTTMAVSSKYFRYRPPSEVLGKINPNQLVGITTKSENKDVVIIESVLQRPISFRTSSKWGPLPTLQDFGMKDIPNMDAIDAGLMAVFGTSTQSTVNSRRMWKGTSPLNIQIDLRFEAFEDPLLEVVAPTVRLMGLTLPMRSAISIGKMDFFLVPPGPAPFPNAVMEKAMNIASGKAGVAELAKSSGEETTIRIGGTMQFERVVLEGANVTWDQRCDANGRPLGSNVSLTFTTWEILTREALNEAVLKVGKF